MPHIPFLPLPRESVVSCDDKTGRDVDWRLIMGVRCDPGVRTRTVATKSKASSRKAIEMLCSAGQYKFASKYSTSPALPGLALRSCRDA